MLHRRSHCCRAVQRKLLSPSESIWISDSLLCAAYESFSAVSRSTRRHGSFVPGPLESRRRLGKRRMAYATGALPQPSMTALDVWSWFRGLKKEKEWRWEAPTARQIEEVDSTTLPGSPPAVDAIDEHFMRAEDLIRHFQVEQAEAELTEQSEVASLEINDVLKFRADLSAQRDSKALEDLCYSFCSKLEDNLMLGTVSSQCLHDTLEIFIAAIGANGQLAQDTKLHCYRTVWTSIINPRATYLSGLSPQISDMILGQVSALNMSSKVRALAHSIVANLPITHFDEMEGSLVRMVQGWSESWLDKEPTPGCQSLISDAGRRVGISQNNITTAREALAGCVGVIREADLDKKRTVLQNLETELLAVMEAVKRVDDYLFPVRKSITNLAKCLERLPQDTLKQVVFSSSHEVKTLCTQRLPNQTRIRSCWLAVLSQLPSVTLDMFIHSWRILGDERSYLQDDAGSELVLSHIISQGYIDEPVLVRNTFESIATGSTRKHYGHILYAIYQHQRKQVWEAASYLFQILSKCNRHYAVYETLAVVNLLGMKPPRATIREAIELLATSNPRIAFSLYSLYVPKLYPKDKFGITRCRGFLISLIHDQKISSKTIWDVMGYPQFEDLTPVQRRQYNPPKPLSMHRIRLITRMATEFSKSRRGQRFAFRNVIQCVHVLRTHGVPISQEVGRAVTRSSVSQSVMGGLWVGTERLQWVTDVIRKAEGHRVEKAVETISSKWNENVHLRLRERESQPLGMSDHVRTPRE